MELSQERLLQFDPQSSVVMHVLVTVIYITSVFLFATIILV